MPRPRGDARERILDAAVRLLREEGVRGFSQPRVAERASVPQGHLTYYFPKRSDLLHEVAKQFSSDVVTEAAKLIEKGTTGFELIGRLARDRERTRVLLGLLVESEQDERLAEALVENTLFVQDALAGLLGGSLGGGRDDVDVELVLCTLWGIGIRHLTRSGRAGEKRTTQLLERLEKSLQPARRRA